MEKDYFGAKKTIFESKFNMRLFKLLFLGRRCRIRAGGGDVGNKYILK